MIAFSQPVLLRSTIAPLATTVGVPNTPPVCRAGSATAFLVSAVTAEAFFAPVTQAAKSPFAPSSVPNCASCASVRPALPSDGWLANSFWWYAG